MARAIVCVAELGAIVAKTQLASGIRWGEAAECSAVDGGTLDPAWIDWFIERGAKIVVAERDDQVVGHVAYLTRELVPQYDWLSLKLQPGKDVLSVGGFVTPRFRGQGLLGSMKGFAARHFIAEGYRRNVSVVDAGNRASLKAHRSIGAYPTARLWRVRIGRLVIVSRDFRPCHATWGEKQRFIFAV